MTNDDALQISAGDGYEVWSMNLAPVNAINSEMLEALHSEIARVRNDSTVAAVVLTSGLRVFSAGADATWMADVVGRDGSAALLEQFNETMDRFRLVCRALRELPALVVAAIGGHALAGGLELAAACDLRFSSDSERLQIGVPEMDLFGAMPSGGGGAQFLARLLGPSRALEFIFDAKPISPQRAQEIGLVERLYPAEELLGAAEAFAGGVAKKAGRVGVAAAKRAIFIGSELSLGAALELDRSIHWDAMRRGNFIPGVDAFVSKFAQGRS